MSACPHNQRGAVTVIGALFIIITLVIMLEVLHISAGSDILDTALQHDAIEALYVAESGVEHASWLYANGFACGALPRAADAGRGTFDITSAWLMGSDCRVRIEGRVTSTNAANAAVRTIEADLRLASTGAWAVDRNGGLWSWDGSTWTSGGSASQDLNAVHCVSASECWAVGKQGVILHYDGTSWTQNVLDPDEEYTSISCAPNAPDFCVLVGKDGGAVTRFWNGSSWSAPLALPGSPEDLNAVTCPSTNVCYAVGDNGDPVLRFNGSSWSIESDNVSENLNGVSCFSDTGCWAVGDNTGNDYTFAQRPGGSVTWNEVTVTNAVASRDLNAVQCLAADDCWAVGDRRPGGQYLVMHWDGSSWSEVAVGAGRDLDSISCSAPDNCIATGDNGSVIRWDGSSWSDASAGLGNQDLVGVSVFGGGVAGAGAVSLVRWTEIIN